MPLGPGRSLFDDARDDTKAFDPEALARLDHLIAALEVAGDLRGAGAPGRAGVSASGDGVAAAGLLPGGGGPAAEFDPTIGKLALAYAAHLLDHVNPETGLALREDPALAWVTLAGEISLFDLIEHPESLPASVRRRAARPCRQGPRRARRPSALGMGRVRALAGRWPTTCGAASSASRSPGSRTGGARTSSTTPRPHRGWT